MTAKLEEDIKGSSRDVFKSIIPKFFQMDWGKQWETSLKIAGLRFEIPTPNILARNKNDFVQLTHRSQRTFVKLNLPLCLSIYPMKGHIGSEVRLHPFYRLTMWVVSLTFQPF